MEELLAGLFSSLFPIIIVITIVRNVLKKAKIEKKIQGESHPSDEIFDLEKEWRKLIFKEEEEQSLVPNESVEVKPIAQKYKFTESEGRGDATPITEIEKGDLTRNSKNEILEDFDLRKAVIYSEILKPKWNDSI